MRTRAFTYSSPCPGGLKLYVPSQDQRPVVGSYVTATLAWKCLNCPVPPENVTTPESVANESVTWPNALFQGPVYSTRSLSRPVAPAGCA